MEILVFGNKIKMEKKRKQKQEKILESLPALPASLSTLRPSVCFSIMFLGFPAFPIFTLCYSYVSLSFS